MSEEMACLGEQTDWLAKLQDEQEGVEEGEQRTCLARREKEENGRSDDL